MSKQLTISDDLASSLEARRRQEGLPSLDAAAERLIRAGLDEDGLPWSVEELRDLMDEADASGPEQPWDAATFREDVLKAYAARKAG